MSILREVFLRFLALLPVAFLAIAAPSVAATLKLQVTDQAGKPLSDAVATLTPDSPDALAAKPPPRDHFIDQKDETFLPLVEIVTAGDQVIFRNSDRTRHHVYTFSPLGSFEFLLKPNEVSTPVKLQKPGVIPVGCNIHDFMINYLFVTDSRWAGRSDEQGMVTLTDVPPGGYTVTWWHPRQRPGSAPATQAVTVSGEQSTASQSLKVMAPPPDAEHERY